MSHRWFRSAAIVSVDVLYNVREAEAQTRRTRREEILNSVVFLLATPPDREDGWAATGRVESDRSVAFPHLLRPTLQLVSFGFVSLPVDLELTAGREHTLVCRIANTGHREGGDERAPARPRLRRAGGSENMARDLGQPCSGGNFNH